MAAAMGKQSFSTVEVSVSCDAGTGVDHFVYADPSEDKVVGDLYKTPLLKIEESKTEGVSCEIGTSYDPPAVEVNAGSSEQLFKLFEREMRLGPSISEHIPSFIADGLDQLRKTFAKTAPIETS